MKYYRGAEDLYMAITVIFALYLMAFSTMQVIYLHISFAAMMAIALIAITLKQKNEWTRELTELKTKNDYLINKLKRKK